LRRTSSEDVATDHAGRWFADGETGALVLNTRDTDIVLTFIDRRRSAAFAIFAFRNPCSGLSISIQIL